MSSSLEQNFFTVNNVNAFLLLLQALTSDVVNGIISVKVIVNVVDAGCIVTLEEECLHAACALEVSLACRNSTLSLVEAYTVCTDLRQCP